MQKDLAIIHSLPSNTGTVSVTQLFKLPSLFLMKKQTLLIISIFLFILFPFTGLSQIRNYEIGASMGFGAVIIKQQRPSLFIPKSSLSYSYHPDSKHGFRTGISYSNNVEGCDEIFEIPIYYSYKTKSKHDHEIKSISSILDLFGLLFPQRVEFFVGPSLGYIERKDDYFNATSANNQYYSDEFVADRKISLSFDISAKPSYQIGPVNIYFSFGVGYLLTRNFKYVSDNPFLSGKRPCFNIKGDIGLSISF